MSASASSMRIRDGVRGRESGRVEQRVRVFEFSFLQIFGQDSATERITRLVYPRGAIGAQLMLAFVPGRRGCPACECRSALPRRSSALHINRTQAFRRKLEFICRNEEKKKNQKKSKVPQRKEVHFHCWDALEMVGTEPRALACPCRTPQTEPLKMACLFSQSPGLAQTRSS